MSLKKIDINLNIKQRKTKASMISMMVIINVSKYFIDPLDCYVKD
jgi:hypothetical protein